MDKATVEAVIQLILSHELIKKVEESDPCRDPETIMVIEPLLAHEKPSQRNETWAEFIRDKLLAA